MYRLRHLPIRLVLQLTVEMNRLGDNTPFLSTFISFYLFPHHIPVNCQHVQSKSLGWKTEGILILYRCGQGSLFRPDFALVAGGMLEPDSGPEEFQSKAYFFLIRYFYCRLTSMFCMQNRLCLYWGVNSNFQLWGEKALLQQKLFLSVFCVGK